MIRLVDAASRRLLEDAMTIPRGKDEGNAGPTSRSTHLAASIASPEPGE